MTLLAAASRYSERSRCWSMSRPTMPTRHGVEIVRRALEAPARQIAENAVAEGSIIIGKLRETPEFAYGWNAQTNEFGDLYKQGVIDPVKVVRTALQDAASVAGLLVTTEAMVAEKPKRKRRSPRCRVAAWTFDKNRYVRARPGRGLLIGFARLDQDPVRRSLVRGGLEPARLYEPLPRPRHRAPGRQR
jgi:hypothetical protein